MPFSEMVSLNFWKVGDFKKEFFRGEVLLSTFFCKIDSLEDIVGSCSISTFFLGEAVLCLKI